MEKLFKALENKFPDHKIIDVAFTYDLRGEYSEPQNTIEEIDAMLADAIDNAEEVDINTLF